MSIENDINLNINHNQAKQVRVLSIIENDINLNINHNLRTF